MRIEKKKRVVKVVLNKYMYTSGDAAIGGITKSMNMKAMKAWRESCYLPFHMG